MPDDLVRSIEEFQRCIEARDRNAAEQILHEEYALVLVQPGPATMPRGRWLDVLEHYVVHSYEVQERLVHVDGDCAAVLHRARMEATVLGEDRSGLFVISDIWRRQGDSWRVWKRHSTPLSAGPLPEGKA